MSPLVPGFFGDIKEKCPQKNPEPVGKNPEPVERTRGDVEKDKGGSFGKYRRESGNSNKTNH